MGAHKEVHIGQISQIPAVASRWEQVHGRPCTEEDIEAMFAMFISLQLDCLAEYANLIPGTIEAVAACWERELNIGLATGYTGEMMELLQSEAKQRGYEPDSTVCATDVPAGRLEPWMCLRNAGNLGGCPMEAVVKVGDTLPDLDEGINAGMWTIGLAKTGNEIDLNEKEIEAFPNEQYDRMIARACRRMYQSGAHHVVDSIVDIMPCLDDIQCRLSVVTNREASSI